VFLAGPLAELRYVHGRSPAGTLTGNTPDLIHARRFLGISEKHNYLVMWMACDEVRRFLRRRQVWQSVCELANTLACTGHVSGEAAEAIFVRYRVPRISKRRWICGE
jgi:hypothetical protein